MLSSYLRIAAKVLLRRKFYTAVSLFGIGFTLMVLVTCTALFDEVFSSGYPETKLDRTLGIEWASMRGERNRSTSGPGYALLDRYARELPGAEAMSIVTRGRSVASFVDGRKLESMRRATDAVFWEVMEFRFLEGGPFSAVDEQQGNFVAVINRTTRERFFGNAPALGQTMRFDGQSFSVIGVVDDVAPTRRLAYSEIWVPIGTLKSTTYRHELIGGFSGIVLARSRSDFPLIKAELTRRLERVEMPDPENYDRLISAANTRFEDMALELVADRDTAEPPVLRLGLLMGGVALLFMTLPALNLVNINLSRILERSSEIGVRKAFGCSSWNLVGQFLVENVVLTLVGGAIGMVMSLGVMAIVNRSDLVPYVTLQLNFFTFFAALLLSLIFGLLSGAYPAWRMSRMHPVQALHGRV